jgi:hypothetical protein
VNPWGITAMEEAVCDALVKHLGDSVLAGLDLGLSPKQVDNAADRARARMEARTRTSLVLAWALWRQKHPKAPVRGAMQCAACGGLGFIVRRA